ncbi:MAG: hypothetical protein IPK39_19660 [Sulfuritalea sp.]|nr:hypothetical protein [Sulfuritalea sp.]
MIADEVGLGKTIEAGLLLRQTWLSGRARRILVLAPKAVLTQWQVELREKFNLDWPIYDGDSLVWQPTPAHRDGVAKPVSRQDWHKEPFVIASSHLMRRRERQTELILDAEPWDLVVLDEAPCPAQESRSTGRGRPESATAVDAGHGPAAKGPRAAAAHGDANAGASCRSLGFGITARPAAGVVPAGVSRIFCGHRQGQPFPSRFRQARGAVPRHGATLWRDTVGTGSDPRQGR